MKEKYLFPDKVSFVLPTHQPLLYFFPGYPGQIAVGIHSNGCDVYQNRFDGHFLKGTGG